MQSLKSYKHSNYKVFKIARAGEKPPGSAVYEILLLRAAAEKLFPQSPVFLYKTHLSQTLISLLVEVYYVKYACNSFETNTNLTKTVDELL